jgi:PKD repeat protein
MYRRLATALLVALASSACHDVTNPPGAAGDGASRSLDPVAWSIREPMPVARWGHNSVTMSDGRIMVIAGRSSTGYTRSVETYDPATGSWTERAPFTDNLDQFGVARAGDGRIYVMGGHNESFFTSYTWVYDENADSWSIVNAGGSASVMTWPRYSFGTATGTDGRIYVTGGRGCYSCGEGQSAIAASDVFDPATQQWSAIAPMPGPRMDHQAVAGRDGRIYVIGGRVPNAAGTGADFTSSVIAYDPATNTWTSVASLPRAVVGNAAALGADGLIYVFIAQGIGQGETWVYDPALDTWFAGPAYPAVSGYYAATTGLDGTIYLSGGILFRASGAVVYDSVRALSTAVSPGNAAPVARLVSEYSMLEGSDLRLDGTASSDADGESLAYVWDFGDGSKATSLDAAPTHRYAEPGTYTVTLVVRDVHGQRSAPATATVTVSDGIPTVGAFDPPYFDETFRAFISLNFKNPAREVLNAHFDWGDGTSEDVATTGPTVRRGHQYSDQGPFTVVVTVSDNDGNSPSGTLVLTVNHNPVLGSPTSYTGQAGVPVQFDAKATDPDGDALVYGWFFPDGDYSELATPTHVFASPGDYLVDLVVYDARNGYAGVELSVHITKAPPVVNTFAGATILRGETYTAAGSFTDAGTGPWTATVDYGSGGGARPLALSGQSFALSNAYSATGAFTVTVSVSDNTGGSGHNAALVRVLAPDEGARILVGGYLDELVTSGALAADDAQPLRNFTDHLVRELERGRGLSQPARAAVESFNKHVRKLAQQGRLSSDKAGRLLGLMERVIASTG